jgi:polyhydroxybutyrate depolymerase
MRAGQFVLGLWAAVSIVGCSAGGGDSQVSGTGGFQASVGGNSGGGAVPGSGGGAAVTGSGGGAVPGSGGGGAATGSGGGVAAPPSQYGTATQATITVAGLPRQYWVMVPADYSATAAATLVFNWHGLNQTFPQTTTWLGVVGVASNAILVYPEAQNPTAGFDPYPDGADFALFDALVAQMFATYAINPARVFSLGHSNGADINSQLGCARGDVLRAVASVSTFWGSPPGSGSGCQGAVGWLFLYGVQDPQVNPPGQPTAVSNALTWILTINGCQTSEAAAPVPVTGATCEDHTQCNPDARVRWCSHPGGHDWPGSMANQLIWDYFQQFP